MVPDMARKNVVRKIRAESKRDRCVDTACHQGVAGQVPTGMLAHCERCHELADSLALGEAVRFNQVTPQVRECNAGQVFVCRQDLCVVEIGRTVLCVRTSLTVVCREMPDGLGWVGPDGSGLWLRGEED